MYKVGDKVMHRREGACYITQTTDMKMEDVQREYFVLSPILAKESNIYVSVDCQKQKSIRPVINREELQEFEKSMHFLNSEWIVDAKVRYRQFMNGISTFDFQEILDIYKCLIRQKEIQTLAAKDKEFLFTVEKLIGSEIAILLELSYDRVLEKMKEDVLSGMA